jgi:hypothetical protein
MNTSQEQKPRSAGWAFFSNLAVTILMMLGTTACLIFSDHGDTVTKGTMGMLLGTVGSMLGTCFSYVDYRMAKLARKA